MHIERERKGGKPNLNIFSFAGKLVDFQKNIVYTHLSHLPLTHQYTVFRLDSRLADKLGSRNTPLNETFFVFTEHGVGRR